MLLDHLKSKLDAIRAQDPDTLHPHRRDRHRGAPRRCVAPTASRVS